MEPPQGHRFAAVVVDPDGTSFSAADTNVHSVVYAPGFIAWDTYSTLDEAHAALQRMEEQNQATWMTSLHQQSSWVETMTPASYASGISEVQGHNPCVLRRLDFDMPTDGLDNMSAESTWHHLCFR